MDPKAILLDLARDAGRFTLEGNREFYTVLEYVKAGGFVLLGGDSMENREEYRTLITDDQAYEHLLSYWKQHALTWGNRRLEDPEEIATHALQWQQR